MKPKYWWGIYGPFDEGEDNAPNMGQVISHYAKLNGVKTAELAQQLTELGWKVGERRMEQLLSSKNTVEPEQISRRKLLSKLLAIPPILFGLSNIENFALSADNPKTQSSINKEALLRYESTLDTYWDNFYSSSILKHSDNIFQWCKHLNQIATNESENRAEVLALLCRFEQLAAVTARDHLDYPRAIYYHSESVNLALELNNAELIAASLVRRARAYIQLKKFKSAVTDIKLALQYGDRLRDNLRGYVYQMASEVITQLPKNTDTTQRFQQYSEVTGKILSKGLPEVDGSFIRLSLSGYQQDRARSFLRIGDPEAALNAIDLAEQTQKPDMTRWQAELNLARAEAYLLSGETEWACHQVTESYRIVKATGSEIQKQNVVTLYNKIAAQHPNQAEVRQLGTLLTTG